MKKVLLGICGASDAKYAADLIVKLKQGNFEVKAILTKAAQNFIYKMDFVTKAFTHPFADTDYPGYHTNMSPKYHIDLATKSDYFLVAPCTANTLAKFANGICDNILSLTMRCWDFKKPVFIAPAMNPIMWEHQFTKEHVNKIISLGEKVEIIVPSEYKFDNCTGIGALAPINTIYACLDRMRYLEEEIEDKNDKTEG